MAKNIIPDIAKMLGVEIGEGFEIDGLEGRYKFTEDSLCESLFSGDGWEPAPNVFFYWLCKGERKIIKLAPKLGEEYYTVDCNGKIEMHVWSGHLYDTCAFALGNYFRTRQLASANKDMIIAKLKEALG